MIMHNQTLKTTFIMFATIISLFAGAVMGLVVHEWSHLIVLQICNGSVVDMSFGSQSFVSGYVDIAYIATVAISSTIIPAILSSIISCIHQYYVRCFTCGFTLPIIINILLGLFATLFVRGNNRSTYDIALAYDYANAQWLVILLSIITLIICVYIVCKKLIQIYNSL